MHTVKKKSLVVITILSSLIYMIWRILFTIPFQYGIWSTIFGLVLLIVELFGFFEMVVHFSQLSTHVLPKAAKGNLEDYPDVDVFISTYNEPPDLLFKTINACQHMDYPDKSKVHIYLCDDGHREEMGVLAHEMGVTYLVRDTHKFAKAGNLNHALHVTHSPYIVTFDADMLPKHDFLTACIPYFLGEEKIGFLQTPQTFYNPDLFQYNLYSEDRFPNEQDYFYRDVQVMRNASNTVIYGGTNTILSRKALEDIGGFYTGVVTEDFATGMMMESKGYRCYAIDESYSCGLSPEDLKSLMKQRQRWARGCIQTGRKVHLFFLKGLSLRQKISYFTSITYWYGPVKRFVYILSPILYAVFNIIVVKCTVFGILLFWLPMYLLNNATLQMLSGNIRNTRLTNIYETILMPGLLPAVLIESLGISQKTFNVTRKDSAQKLKSDGKWFAFKNSILLLVFYALTVWGLGRCIYATFQAGIPMYIVILFWLFVNLFNLTMALFFIYGRKHHRRYERFDAKVDCVLSFGDCIIRAKTVNISEHGISVELNFPEYIPPDEELTVKLVTDRYRTTWTGKIANVLNVGEKWRYGIAMSTITADNKREMLQIVYDRDPSLPKEIDAGLSTVDDIMVNVWKRAGGSSYYSRRLPRVELFNFVETADHHKCLLRDFNYEYLTVRFFGKQPVPDELVIVEHGFSLHCVLKDRNARLGVCYEILNAQEVFENVEFRNILKSWMYDYEIDADAKEAYLKNIKKDLKRFEAFREFDYL